MVDQTPPQVSSCSRQKDSRKGPSVENTKKDNNAGATKQTPALPSGPTPVPDLVSYLDHLGQTLPSYHAVSCRQFPQPES